MPILKNLAKFFNLNNQSDVKSRVAVMPCPMHVNVDQTSTDILSWQASKIPFLEQMVNFFFICANKLSPTVWIERRKARQFWTCLDSHSTQTFVFPTNFFLLSSRWTNWNCFPWIIYRMREMCSYFFQSSPYSLII